MSPRWCAASLPMCARTATRRWLNWSNKFDRAGVGQETLKLSAADIDAGVANVSKEQLAAIGTAATRIEKVITSVKCRRICTTPTTRACSWAGAGPA